MGKKKKDVSRLREDIMTRCYNPKSIMYEKYGGRGIEVCEEWHDLEKFKEWAYANGFNGAQRIERLDSSKGYSPDNCILGTKYKKKGKEDQANNMQTYIPMRISKNESLPLGMWVNKNGRIVVKDSPLHGRYHAMRMRCENPKDKDYKFYGARGISVCEEWRGKGGEYRFIMWAAKSGYKEGLQLDRIDNNSGYSPENCRWATIEEQQNNRRGNKLCKFNGEKKTIAEIARASKIPYNKALYLINALGVETEIVK